MMRNLIQRLFRIIKLRELNAGVCPAENINRGIALIVDLIKGHPILDLVLISLHDSCRVAYEEINHLAIHPTAVFLCQIIGHFKVAQRDNRLNTMLVQFIKHIIIKLQTSLIRLQLVTVGENTAPGNGSAEALEAQFTKECDIVLISVKKIDTLMIRIALSCDNAVRNAAGNAMCSGSQDIANAPRPSSFQPPSS